MNAIAEPGPDQIDGLLGRGQAAMAFSAACLFAMFVFLGLAIRAAGAVQVPRPLVSTVAHD